MMISMTPIQLAIDINNDEIIQLFLSNEFCKLTEKIDINKKSIGSIILKNKFKVFEKTPLYMAIEQRNINTIKSLLMRTDIDVNKMSFFYPNSEKICTKAALHLAVEMNDIEIVRILLEKKEINVNIEDYQGKRPIDYSTNDEIKKLLSQ